MNRILPACPVEISLLLIKNKWRVLILRELMTGTKRFSELQRAIAGITQKVLTANLRAMEAEGLLARKVYPVVPPKVEYSLTEVGRSLDLILKAMAEYGEIYRSKYNN